MKEFYQRMRYCVERAGGQTELAKKVGEHLGKECKPQTIQRLCRGPSANHKPAQTSKLTKAIAEVLQLEREWLETGEGPMESDPASSSLREELPDYSSLALPPELVTLLKDIYYGFQDHSLDLPTVQVIQHLISKLKRPH